MNDAVRRSLGSRTNSAERTTVMPDSRRDNGCDHLDETFLPYNWPSDFRTASPA
ncbi:MULTISPECIES: hypothetical protein [Streptomyces]|uniref:hypothetical protein n=1 Tax=Streptomyces TaxID=1883 RepID=UPI000A8D60E1|nr:MULTISPECIES: hypothetical protein [Streptomyces]